MRKLIIIFSFIPTITFAQPFPGAVNINGNWVPCNHPIAINAGLSCTTSPIPPVINIQSGKYYRHKTAGWKFYILSPVQKSNGDITLLAEVIIGRDYLGRELFTVGTIIPVKPQFNGNDWEETGK